MVTAVAGQRSATDADRPRGAAARLLLEHLRQHRPLRREARAARAVRIPLHPLRSRLSSSMSRSCSSPPPTAGGQGRGEEKGAVPKQVIRFLNDEQNRSLIRGVISAGNTNFGEHFCLAGDIISRKCHVPHLYRLELFGTPEDVDRVSEGLERWWKLQ